MGEFTALVAKALRGAGYPWGLAEDGASSASTLAQHHFPAGDVVARLLGHVDRHGFDRLMVGNVDTDADGPLCPIWVGVAVSDDPTFAPVLSNREVLEPLLLAPWAWNGAIPHRTIEIEFPVKDDRPLASRVLLDQAIHDALVGFAARTYAPATDESRASGAGETP